MNAPCSILVEFPDEYLFVELEQVTCPARFMDTAGYLPHIIRTQLDTFCENHTTSGVSNCGITLTLSKPVRHSRRHIVWSSVTYGYRQYVVSMVMPTLNFSTFRLPISHVVAGDCEASVMVLRNEVRRIE
jgi:hypothetical protein